MVKTEMEGGLAAGRAADSGAGVALYKDGEARSGLGSMQTKITWPISVHL